MSEAKKTVCFWVGSGTLGKCIKHGDPIPEGVIDAKTIKAQKALGNIQDKEVSDKAAENIMVAETLLKDAQAEIKNLNDLVDSQKKELAAKDKELEKMKNESEESLKAEIKTLKAENRKLAKDIKK